MFDYASELIIKLDLRCKNIDFFNIKCSNNENIQWLEDKEVIEIKYVKSAELYDYTLKIITKLNFCYAKNLLLTVVLKKFILIR